MTGPEDKPALVVHIQVGEPTDLAVWCDECLKPAAIEFPIHALIPDGVSNIGSTTHCFDCHPVNDDDE